MAKRYIMTAKRKAALRKAQLMSARKRRGKGGKRGKSRKRIAWRTSKGIGVLALLGGGAVGARRYQPYSFKDSRLGEPGTPRFTLGGGNGVGVEWGRGSGLYGAGIRPRKNFRHVSGGFTNYTKRRRK